MTPRSWWTRGLVGSIASAMPDDGRLTITDVFALPLDDPDEARVQLLDRACDRHYFMYVDSAGNEVRLPAGAEWPDEVDIIPIWTKDHVDQIVEWTNVDPAELFFYCDPEWSVDGAGWVRVRAREPGE